MLSLSVSLSNQSGVLFMGVLIYNFLLRGNGGLGTGLFSAETSNSTRGNGLTLFRERFRLNWGPGLWSFRKRLFSRRVVGH